MQLGLCRCAECLSLDKFLRYGLVAGSSLHDVHTRSEVAVRNLNAVGCIEAHRASESVNVQTIAAEREVGHYNLLSVANASCMLAESHLHAILYSASSSINNEDYEVAVVSILNSRTVIVNKIGT